MTALDQRPTSVTQSGSQENFPQSVTARETHSAIVLLLETIAYKMKKPIKTDFLDFRTVESRWSALEREYILNARFAPDVYVGIAELTDPAGGASEPLLKMLRLPDSAKLAVLAADGADLTEQLAAIARIVARVHRNSPRREAIDHEGTREALRGRWSANIRELRELSAGILDSTTVDEIGFRATRFIDGRGALFDARIDHGHIVDGHGDLLADDIFCMEDGPRILDCLDFDDKLRYVDRIDDAACLAMDLEYLQRADAARYFLDSYLEAACDAPPRSLIDHYIAYRATVRAKVACLRARQGRTESVPDAVEHARLALEHLESATMTMTLIGGLPGTGKSTLAAGLARKTGAIVLSTDIVRKELAGLEPTDSRADPFEQGLYTPSMTDHTYAELRRRARSELAAGRSVILDGSWSDPGMRERAGLLASMSYSELVEIECRVPADVSLRRIGNRRVHVSDATREVYEAMASTRRTWRTATVVDCSRDVDESVRAASAALSSAIHRVPTADDPRSIR